MHKNPIAPTNCPKTLIKDIDELTKIWLPGPVQEGKKMYLADTPDTTWSAQEMTI